MYLSSFINCNRYCLLVLALALFCFTVMFCLGCLIKLSCVLRQGYSFFLLLSSWLHHVHSYEYASDVVKWGSSFFHTHTYSNPLVQWWLHRQLASVICSFRESQCHFLFIFKCDTSKWLADHFFKTAGPVYRCCSLKFLMKSYPLW